MNIGTSSILLQLALDYNQLISSAESSQVQQQITDALVDDDIFDYESDSDDELVVELERLEDKMIIQMVIKNGKRQISFPNPTCNNKKRRKDRYDTSKTYFTDTKKRLEIRFSEWLESLRKDIECIQLKIVVWRSLLSQIWRVKLV